MVTSAVGITMEDVTWALIAYLYTPIYLFWLYKGAVAYPLIICLFMTDWDTDFCSWDDGAVAF